MTNCTRPVDPVIDFGVVVKCSGTASFVCTSILLPLQFYRTIILLPKILILYCHCHLTHNYLFSPSHVCFYSCHHYHCALHHNTEVKMIITTTKCMLQYIILSLQFPQPHSSQLLSTALFFHLYLLCSSQFIVHFHL